MEKVWTFLRKWFFFGGVILGLAAFFFFSRSFWGVSKLRFLAASQAVLRQMIGSALKMATQNKIAKGFDDSMSFTSLRNWKFYWLNSLSFTLEMWQHGRSFFFGCEKLNTTVLRFITLQAANSSSRWHLFEGRVGKGPTKTYKPIHGSCTESTLVVFVTLHALMVYSIFHAEQKQLH